ncbi:D-alanyl-D-alanine carboxypeptidase [Clostridiaceae bacterium Marseille-Q3526]|nr:D-alanyl-D-alanine carboxypeptidase [Clostridiaceae bacterium Marseille-Q3526]
MDAASGTVLYGKNIHETYAPASITKVLTSIIVLEQCDLDEVVTFSKNAVYNVEADSSSAGYDTGDTATVKDCLYALLLKSANESANALAEHTAGSTEAFAELMNEKAKELGCVDSHFANPSGLNDENHYVSAYDMALITRYAFQNETFREIASTTYYELPPNARNPEGLGVSPGNKMVKKNFPEYRPDVIGGKTGYTSIALNTLVIGARQDDTELITVVLHSNGTTYSDTSRLLDFGFQNFRSVPLAGNDTSWEQLSSSLTIAGLPTSQAPALTVDPDSRIVLPNHAEFDETTSQISFDLPENAPENAIAAIHYFLGSHEAGTAWLTLGTNASDSTSPIPAKLLEIAPDTIAQVDFKDEEEKQEGNEASASQEAAASQDGESQKEDGMDPGTNRSKAPAQADASKADKASNETLKQMLPILIPVLLVLAAAAGLGAAFFHLSKKRQKEENDRQERRRKRLERLKESGVSEDEFNEMMKNRRLSIPLEPDRRSFRRPKSSRSHSGSLLSGAGEARRSSRGRDKGFSLKRRRWWKR